MANLSGTWERRALFLGLSAAWSTASDATLRYRETSGVIPYMPAPVVPPPGPMGSGLPYMNISDYQTGRPGVAFSTTMPMTDIVARDHYALLFNGQSNDETGALSVWSPLGVPATGLVVWKTEAQTWATVGVEIDDDATASSAFIVDSAMPTSVTLNIVQNAPGESSGMCELTADWIGNASTRTTAVSVNSPVSDTSDFFFTQNCVFKLVATAEPFISASITITNGATLDPSAAAEATGITMGPITATGTVTMLADMTNAQLPDQLFASLETTTQASKQMALLFEIGSSFKVRVPAVITGPPSWSDIGGINALTFNFMTGGDVEGASALAPEVITLGGTSPSIFYVAP